MYIYLFFAMPVDLINALKKTINIFFVRLRNLYRA